MNKLFENKSANNQENEIMKPDSQTDVLLVWFATTDAESKMPAIFDAQ